MPNVTIDGTEYAPITTPTEWRIVIAQRGWVFVGRYHEDGDDVTLTDASVIRRWGAKAMSLGGLTNGPLSDTVLDPVGTVRLHRLGIVATLDCAGSWGG